MLQNLGGIEVGSLFSAAGLVKYRVKIHAKCAIGEYPFRKPLSLGASGVSICAIHSKTLDPPLDVQCATKKYPYPKDFCRFLSNHLEFLREI